MTCRLMTTAVRRTAATMAKTRTNHQPACMAHRRHYLSTRSLSTSDGNNNETSYVSPLQDLFDQMERNETSLGTTAPVQEPPSPVLNCGVPESLLRFTTTCYGRTMNAPYVQPKEHAVALKVNLEHLQLTDLELELLRNIVGKRINHHELRLQSNQFASRMENKRHAMDEREEMMQSGSRCTFRDGRV
ncbi:hypothetical protein MPSEU_000353600 [Mayamaea pseudoterrestris]|nr:hypothetical protein MPSEU_000353600 [Mayamaea pseudoterrestris]